MFGRRPRGHEAVSWWGGQSHVKGRDSRARGRARDEESRVGWDHGWPETGGVTSSPLAWQGTALIVCALVSWILIVEKWYAKTGVVVCAEEREKRQRGAERWELQVVCPGLLGASTPSSETTRQARQGSRCQGMCGAAVARYGPWGSRAQRGQGIAVSSNGDRTRRAKQKRSMLLANHCIPHPGHPENCQRRALAQRGHRAMTFKDRRAIDRLRTGQDKAKLIKSSGSQLTMGWLSQSLSP